MSGDLKWLEAVPDALVVVDEHGRIAAANRQAEQLFGYAPGELSGLPVESLMPEGARERHHAHRNGYMAASRVRPMGGSGMALVGQRRDGQQFPVEIALSPLETGAGLRYLASVRDISETQRARQALVRARYDALVARVGQLALESTAADTVVAGLPALLVDALGIDAAVIVFLRDDTLDVHAQQGFDTAAFDDAARQRTAVEIARGQTSVVEDAAHDERHRLVFPAARGSSAIVPLSGGDRPIGALMAWAGEPRRFDHDALHLLQSSANLLAALLQRRRTEEQLAHAQRLDAIGQLTGGIAHDFNNLLTVMSGSLQLLEMEVGDRPEAAELIASALRSAGRGAELTSKLLAFARRQKLSPSAVSPPQLLRDLELMLRRTLGESVHLHVQCPEDIAAVYADASQLDAALVNLSLNARDAMPRGGDITLSVVERRHHDPQPDRPDRFIVFTVTDTGLGMTPETLARAVEPFFTTKGAGRGSGLGLSMVYGFVEQSGGHFHIDSRLGYGTRVELWLPAARSAQGAGSAHAGGAMSGAGERVLVVEDEDEVRAIAAMFLRSLGYQVVAVGNAAQALQQLRQDASIAVLFSDVMLGPGMNGRELANAARDLRPELPVLLTSGYEDAPDDGRHELLRKPYRREDLAAALHRHLSGRSAGDQ